MSDQAAKRSKTDSLSVTGLSRNDEWKRSEHGRLLRPFVRTAPAGAIDNQPLADLARMHKKTERQRKRRSVRFQEDEGLDSATAHKRTGSAEQASAEQNEAAGFRSRRRHDSSGVTIETRTGDSVSVKLHHSVGVGRKACLRYRAAKGDICEAAHEDDGAARCCKRNDIRSFCDSQNRRSWQGSQVDGSREGDHINCGSDDTEESSRDRNAGGALGGRVKGEDQA
jgi:hypothetical protein